MREASGAPFDRLRVDGGATHNDWLMQFQADVLGVPGRAARHRRDDRARRGRTRWTRRRDLEDRGRILGDASIHDLHAIDESPRRGCRHGRMAARRARGGVVGARRRKHITWSGCVTRSVGTLPSVGGVPHVRASDGVTPIVSAAVRPKVMIVGQAPGQVEAAGGKPFAGRAGKTLFRWLERAGTRRIHSEESHLHRGSHALLSRTESERSR